jgi:chitin synthase
VAHNQGIRLTTTQSSTPLNGKGLLGPRFSLRFADRKNRQSSVSNTDTGLSYSQGFETSTMESFANAGGSRQRHDSNQLLLLPAPLALNRPATNGGSSTSVARSSEDVYSDHSSSYHRALPSRSSIVAEQPVEEPYTPSGMASPRHASPSRGYYDHQGGRTPNGYAAVRQVIAPTPFPGESTNPFQSGNDPYNVEHDVGPSTSPSPSGGQPRVRGISLSDNGPVPGPDGVRRVSRPTARRTSQTLQQNRYSRSPSIYANLPAGASPPNPNGGHS